MKAHKVVFTDFALAQLDSLSGRLIKEIVDTASLLEANPHMFELMDRYVRRQYRRFLVLKHRVIYRVDEERSAVYVVWVGPSSATPPLENDLEASEKT